VTPLFIFSGTFFPISQLPDFLEWIAYLTPLWHGVALARQLALGQVDQPLALLNIAVLVAYIAVGVAFASRTFARRLVQ
jgi:lipooligosaccharide transport system permease protein